MTFDFRAGGWLRAYFRSGWAFLTPYLAAYLLYWWLRWPVNPAAAEAGVKVASESGSLASSLPHSLVPPLLHVYWALHAINAVLAIAALAGWWHSQRSEIACEPAPTDTPAAPGTPTSSTFTPAPRSAAHSSPSLSLSLSLRLAPWLLLALVFWIPGVYLEWPSDPWEHYRRINEWQIDQTVAQHSTHDKSAYFLAYSFIGRITPPLTQIKWFDLYYTGCCLLLCWQYYRLARAVGLGERASMIFVILQTLLFGNNIFGFYRYYGMSSTLFSQLGAVALTRIAIEALSAPREQGAGSKEQEGSALRLPVGAYRAALPVLRPLFSVLCLVPLTAFNHIQGIGIAGLEVAAVVVWRLIEWHRSMILWLAAAVFVLSAAAVLIFPKDPVFDSQYVPQRFLNSWYAFDLFHLSSPSFDRALQIVGGLGLVNVMLSLFLVRRNHVVAWLTILPGIAVCAPMISIPFADAIARHSASEIMAFHRVFFAIPCGLAAVCFCASVATENPPIPGSKSWFFDPRNWWRWPLWPLAISAVVLVPAISPGFNRIWNMVAVCPSDLSVQGLALDEVGRHLDQANPGRHRPLAADEAPHDASDTRRRTLAALGIESALTAMGRHNTYYLYYQDRLMTYPTVFSPASRTDLLMSVIDSREPRNRDVVVFVPHTSLLVTPQSDAAVLSSHWLPQEVAIGFCAAPEIRAAAQRRGGVVTDSPAGSFFHFGD